MDFKPLWYDPPSGWMYGFPKAWPEGIEVSTENLKIQLTLHGYPAKDIPLALKHTRYGG
jgi:hypothetical protein